MGIHDLNYKAIFAHAEMIRDLLRGFVREDWVDQLNFRTLEHVNGTYVGDKLEACSDDIVWRVSLGGQTLYIYLLIEFQFVLFIECNTVKRHIGEFGFTSSLR